MRKIDVENVSHSVKLTLSGVFNTLSADGNYPVQYGENVQLLTKMQVSAKRKTFSQFFGRQVSCSILQEFETPNSNADI